MKLKGALCNFNQKRNKLNKQTLNFHGWMNKLTLKDDTVSYFSLHVADPATFSFKPYISSENSVFVHLSRSAKSFK